MLLIEYQLFPTDRRGQAVLQAGGRSADGKDGWGGDACVEIEPRQVDAGERGTEQEDHREGKRDTGLPGEAQDQVVL